MARTKITIPIIKTREEAIAMTREIVLLQIEEKQAVAERDKEITAIRTKYEKSSAVTARLIRAKQAQLAQWAHANEAEFDGLKSTDLVHARVGFRTGNWTVEARKGYSFTKIVEAIKDLDDWKRFIRQVPELNKDALIAEREKLDASKLAEVGLKITRDESFYVDSKTEESAKAA